MFSFFTCFYKIVCVDRFELIVLIVLFRSVFWALFGAIYLCFGFPEVYRVLFEVFGMDPEDKECQPKLRRQLEDVDYVSVEFEGNKLTWQDVAAYKASFIFLSFHSVTNKTENNKKET